MYTFDEIQVGMVEEIEHRISQEDIRKFVDLTGDDNKLHVNDAFASKTSFKKPVAHGMLGASFISTIIGTKLPGDGALWFSQNLEFLLPVRVGDQLTIRAEVTGKNERNRTIELKTEIFNQFKQKVTTGSARVKAVEFAETDKAQEESRQELKNVLVIGASGGMGSAICASLAEKGYNLALHYHSNKSRVEEIQHELEGKPVSTCILQADLLKAEDITRLVEQVERKLGSVDIVINAATVKFAYTKFEQSEWKDFQEQFDINIRSNYNLLKQVVPLMKARKGGRIILFSTMYTEGTPPSELTHYIMAKSALNAFARSLAVELGPSNITVNVVSPGMTETDLIADVPEKAKLLAAAKAPLRRIATPADVAAVVTFLASEGAGYITGETIRINGGQSMI